MANHEHDEIAPSTNRAIYVDENGFVKMTGAPSSNSPPSANLTGTRFDSGIIWDASSSTDPNNDSLEYKFIDTDGTNTVMRDWDTEAYYYKDYGDYDTSHSAKVEVRDGNGGQDSDTATANTGDDSDDDRTPTK